MNNKEHTTGNIDADVVRKGHAPLQIIYKNIFYKCYFDEISKEVTMCYTIMVYKSLQCNTSIQNYKFRQDAYLFTFNTFVTVVRCCALMILVCLWVDQGLVRFSGSIGR